MSWKSLFEAARPGEPLAPRDAKWWAELRGAIEAAEPAIFWYPGSGEDFTPLVLDVPNNPAKQRIFPLTGPREQRPLMLWMNDYAPDYAQLPKRRGHCSQSANAQLWKRLRADVAVMRRRVHLTLPADRQPSGHGPIHLRLFEVRVTNDSQAAQRQRPSRGDRYTVIFSPAESAQLLRSVIVKHRLHVELVALIRQGGLSGQRPMYPYMKPFQQYTDLPLLLDSFGGEIGHVAGYVVDRCDWRLRGYIETSLRVDKWGADGARLFVREGSDLALRLGDRM